ncbi:MAG: magnesium transporter, partial [Pseudomonadales bacterium]|nr:magnesium transporter [Pseudomonadales bacterium]
MTVLRHYFISDNLDDLEALEEELERQDVETTQIHVLSLDDSGTENHVHLNDVSSFMKKDIV